METTISIDKRLYYNTPDLGQAQGGIKGGNKKVVGSRYILKVETMDQLLVSDRNKETPVVFPCAFLSTSLYGRCVYIYHLTAWTLK